MLSFEAVSMFADDGFARYFEMQRTAATERAVVSGADPFARLPAVASGWGITSMPKKRREMRPGVNGLRFVRLPCDDD